MITKITKMYVVPRFPRVGLIISGRRVSLDWSGIERIHEYIFISILIFVKFIIFLRYLLLVNLVRYSIMKKLKISQKFTIFVWEKGMPDNHQSSIHA